MTPPKLFISYSWSSPEHQQWVIDLATQLRESGIDVILDKWDLKEGHDAVAFMEKMVTDPSIDKVAVISDKTYAEKADGRAGGVGTETQIISREVYEKRDQEKFVAILPCRDEDGKPYLPTYYKSRIYIDLSEPEKYAENFEKLQRWVFNKPLLVKPEIGSRPAFLDDADQVSLGTTATFRRSVEAIRSGKTIAAGSVDEYFSIFAGNLERFRIQKTAGKEIDDLVVESIDHFLPYRNEMIQLLVAIAQYSPSAEMMQKTHRLFETLLSYMRRPEGVQQVHQWDCENFKFIVHELFLYAIAIFTKYERFEFANELLTTPYYVHGNAEYGREATCDFTAFRDYMNSLDHRNKRLELRRLSLRADMLEQRSKTSGVDFRSVMQADFILFIRADREGDRHRSNWWPDTLLYATHSYGPLEVFARSVSKAYFDRAKRLLAIEAPSDLQEQMAAYREDRNSLPRWSFERFSPDVLLGFDKLASKP